MEWRSCSRKYALIGGADYCVFSWVAALKSVCLANKLNIIHGRKRLDVGYILYVLQALDILSNSLVKMLEYGTICFYGWFALLIFFNYSFLLESLVGLAGAFQTVGSVVFFYQKLGLHLFRLRELRVTQRFLTVSSSFEEKNFFRQLSLAYRWNFSSIYNRCKNLVNG